MKKHITKLALRIYSFLIRAQEKSIYDGYRAKYNIHPDFIFNGNGISMYGDGIIKIDEHSYIGRNSILQVSKDYQISIGKNCKIGPYFCVWTQSACVDHDYNFEETIKPKIGNIIINNAVWIGAHVVISPGITIGENSIIGANSVVTKDVPPFAIVGGVPARIIRYKNIQI